MQVTEYSKYKEMAPKLENQKKGRIKEIFKRRSKNLFLLISWGGGRVPAINQGLGRSVWQGTMTNRADEKCSQPTYTLKEKPLGCAHSWGIGVRDRQQSRVIPGP